MINIGTLLATLRIRDQLTPALKKAQLSLKNAGPKMAAAGRSMTMGVTVPLIAAGAAAIKFAVDMNKSMANVATLIPGSTERVLELKKGVQDLAIETGKSTADLADGLYQVVSAFGDSADTAKILELNAKAAAAGLATTSDAIALTSAVTKGYGDTSFEAMQKASDLAFTTVKLGQTSFPELAGAIGKVAIGASGLKITQEELNAVFATMTGVTGPAAEVATQFRGAMVGLKKPSKDMTIALKGIGFETGEAAIASLGFQGTLKALMTQTGGNAGEMAKLFESTESWDFIQGVASTNSEKFTSNLDAMAGAAGATDQAFTEQTEGVNAAGHAWNQLSSSFTVLLQQIGDELIPTFSKVVASIASSVKWFSALSPTVKKVIVIVAALAAAIGPVLMVLGFLATGIAAVSLPVMGVVAALAVVVGAFIKWRKEIVAFVRTFNNIFYGALDRLRVRLGKMTEAEAAAAKAQRSFTEDVEEFVPVVTEVTDTLEAQAPALAQVVMELDEATVSTHELDEATTDLDEAAKALNARIDDQVTAWRVGGLPAMEHAMLVYKRFGGSIQSLSTNQLKTLRDDLQSGMETLQRNGEAIPTEEYELWESIMAKLGHRVGFFGDDLGFLTNKRLPLFSKALDLGAEVSTQFRGDIKGLQVALMGVNTEAQKAPGIFSQWGASVKGGFTELWQGMTGGSGKISGLFTSLGSGIMDGFGSIISGGLSSLINMGVGLAMKGLGKLGGWIKGLFGRSKQEKAAEAAEVAAAQEALRELKATALRIKTLTKEAAEGLRELLREGQRTGELLPQHLDPYLETLRELGALTKEEENLLKNLAQEAHVDWKAMQTSAEKYGIALTELGPAFDRKRLTAAAKAIVKDWEILNQEGVNTKAVLEGMSESVQALVDDAYKAGVDIPRNMQPIMKEMIAQGLLTDASGQKLTDMSQLNFAEPIEKKFEALITKIDELITRLIGPDGVTEAVGKVAQGVQKIPDSVTVDIGFDVDDYNLPDFDDINVGINYRSGGFPEVPDYRHGTGGRFVDFGAGTPAILHGRERVTTEGEGRSEAASMVGVEKRLTSIERLLRDQPRAFGLAISDTMNLQN